MNAKDIGDQTPLQISKDETLEFLQKIQIRNDTIFEACKTGDLQTIIGIISSNFFIHTVHDSNLLIHIAAQHGHLRVVEYLGKQKANLNSRTQDDRTPLHYAAENGHLNVVSYLVNQKADINAKNNRDEFLYLIELLFITLQRMVILVLLNI